MLRHEFPHTRYVVFDNRYILREHGNLIVNAHVLNGQEIAIGAWGLDRNVRAARRLTGC